MHLWLYCTFNWGIHRFFIGLLLYSCLFRSIFNIFNHNLWNICYRFGLSFCWYAGSDVLQLKSTSFLWYRAICRLWEWQFWNLCGRYPLKTWWDLQRYSSWIGKGVRCLVWWWFLCGRGPCCRTCCKSLQIDLLRFRCNWCLRSCRPLAQCGGSSSLFLL